MKFKLTEIKSKEYKQYKGKVYDLTVKDDHSYNINNIVVHNSICKTRIQTGIGVPTLSTILDSARWKSLNSPSLIADGGIRYPGDFAKSIAAGADAIMVGRILAGSEEAPGEAVEGYKVYRGMACYSSDTEVLTDNGWIKFKSLTSDNLIASLNKETKNIEYNKPIKLFKYKYSGKMYRVNTKDIDLLVTPNHNLYIGKKNDHKATDYKLIRADEAYSDFNIHRDYNYRLSGNWSGTTADSFNIPNSNISFNMNEWLDFYGFWLAKGCAYQYKQKKIYTSNVVSISDQNHNLLLRYQEILSNSGIKSSIKSKISASKEIIYELRSYNKNLYNYLSKFGKAKDKYIEKEFKSLSKNQLNIIIESMLLGNNNSIKSVISTTSRKLADDLSELSIKTGRNGSIHKIEFYDINGKKIKRNYNLLQVNIESSNLETYVTYNNVSKENYDGYVYCAEVDNNVICVRRNEKYVWCGNSKEVQSDKRGGLKPGTCAEGVSTLIESTGPVAETLQEFRGGLVSSMTYLNAKNLEEYRLNAKLIRITSAGMDESHAFGTKK